MNSGLYNEAGKNMWNAIENRNKRKTNANVINRFLITDFVLETEKPASSSSELLSRSAKNIYFYIAFGISFILYGLLQNI